MAVRNFLNWCPLPVNCLSGEKVVYQNGDISVLVSREDIAKCIVLTPRFTKATFLELDGRLILRTNGDNVTECPWSPGIASQLILAEQLKVSGVDGVCVNYTRVPALRTGVAC